MNKKGCLIIAVLFGFLAIFRFPCVDLRLSLRLLFEMFVSFSFAYYMWNTNKWMAMFLILATFSVVIPYYGTVSLVSHMAFVSIFFGMVIYYIIANNFTKETIEYLYNAMCIIAIVNTLYMIMQFFDYDFLFKPKEGFTRQSVGLMLNVNFASALLAFCFPAFLRKKWRYFIPLICIGLILAKSSGGVFAIAAGVAVYFILRGSKFAIILPILGMLLFGIFVDKNLSIKDVRFEAWQFALSLWEKHWIMGAGIGNWKIIGILKHPSLQNQGWTALHNDFIQTLFEMGVGFIIILGGYLYDIYRRFNHKSIIPLVAFVVICVNSMVNFPFHIGTTAMLGIVWLAILEIHLKEEVYE